MQEAKFFGSYGGSVEVSAAGWIPVLPPDDRFYSSEEAAELVDLLIQAREHIEREKAGGSSSGGGETTVQDPDERRQAREALKAKVAMTQNERFNPDEAKGALGQMAAIVGRRCREERSLS
jgi:hypothetical protein